MSFARNASSGSVIRTALEAADQTAVISGRDREVFFRALQEFANRGKLDFSVARKDASKGRRR